MENNAKKYSFYGVKKSINLKYEEIITGIKEQKPELKSDAKVIEHALQILFEDVKNDYVRVPRESYKTMIHFNKEFLKSMQQVNMKQEDVKKLIENVIENDE